MQILQILSYEEGYMPKPYLCSEGYVTIGYGTKIHKKKHMPPENFLISVDRETAAKWLLRDLRNIEAELRHGSRAAIFNDLYGPRADIILSMCYQMGVPAVMNFKKMWFALEQGHYATAATEMLDSKWATQTPGRARRHAHQMEDGETHPLYRQVSPILGV